MKKYLIIALLLISATTFGQLSLINVGTAANDKTGDPLRTAFQKTNLAITQINTNTANILLKANLISPTFMTSVALPATITLPSGAVFNFEGDVLVTHSADLLTVSGGNLSLGTNSLLLTGSLGATGAGKITKLWTIDGEFTNLPTINGGTLVSALPFTSYVPYSGASGTVALGVNGITSTGTFSTTGARITKIWTTDIESTNLPTVNGGTLKAALSLTSTDVSLGNLTNKLQIEAEDSVSYPLGYMSRYDGVTGLALKANLASPTFTGTVIIPSPFTLGATSVTTTGTQVNYLNTATGTDYIDDALLFDSAVDTLITKSAARALIISAGGSATSKMQFIVDTTVFAPAAGDSIFKQDTFIDKHLEIYRGVGGGALYKQYRNPTGALQLYHDGYRFQKSTGTIIFKPVFATNEHVAIEVTDSTKWTDIIPVITFCDEYQTVYDEFTRKPANDTALMQNTMVAALVAGGFWARMDAFWCFAQVTNTNGEAWLNWKDPTGDDNVTDRGTTTFTKLEGFTGDGTSDNTLNSNFNPSTEGVNFTLNDESLGVYTRIDVGESKAVIGNTNSYVSPHTAAGNMGSKMGSTSALTTASTNGQGLFIATRTASNAIENFRNGVSLGTATSASTGLTNETLGLLYTRGGSDYSTNQISIAFAMDGVDVAAALAIYTIIEAYMDAIGKGF